MSEAGIDSVSTQATTPTVAPTEGAFPLKARFAATPPSRHSTRTVGQRTRTEELPYGVATRTEIPHTPIRDISEMALGASVRAAALNRTEARPRFPLRLQLRDLRRKVRVARMPNLILFVVDGSGSMSARHRMNAVKGAILSLLLDAYQKRDPVGMITFRDASAQVVLSPTKSVLAAKRHLATLPTGGRTPLAEGLRCAYTLLDRVTQHHTHHLPFMVVLTDGRANVALTGKPANATALKDAYTIAGQIAARGWSSLVIDCETGQPLLGLAIPLAEALKGGCLRLDKLSAANLKKTIQQYL
jgi:magnesium chelatase subunit D